MRIYIKGNKVVRFYDYLDKDVKVLEVYGLFKDDLKLYDIVATKHSTKFEYISETTGLIYPVSYKEARRFKIHSGTFNAISGIFEFYKAGDFTGIRYVDVHGATFIKDQLCLNQ